MTKKEFIALLTPIKDDEDIIIIGSELDEYGDYEELPILSFDVIEEGNGKNFMSIIVDNSECVEEDNEIPLL